MRTHSKSLIRFAFAFVAAVSCAEVRASHTVYIESPVATEDFVSTANIYVEGYVDWLPVVDTDVTHVHVKLIYMGSIVDEVSVNVNASNGAYTTSNGNNGSLLVAPEIPPGTTRNYTIVVTAHSAQHVDLASEDKPITISKDEDE